MTVEDDVLDVVRKYCEAIRVTYTPDIVLNGPEYFLGEDAEELVYSAAERIGIPRAVVDRGFQFVTYFEPEIPFFPPFVLFLMIKRALGLGRAPPQRPALTARAFARILADLKRTAENPTEGDRPSGEQSP
jgi:hypothetical protein